MCHSDESEVIRLTVPAEAGGERLDKYLATVDELGLSRSKIQSLIDAGSILIDGHTVDKKLSLQGGEEVEVTIPAPEPSELVPEDIPLNIVYEDEHLLVVDKPAGMVTHPAAGNWSGTLANGLAYHFAGLAAGSSPMRPGIVHRLDKSTSGLLVVAKTDEAYAALREALDRREMHRHYLCVIWGHMKDDEGSIDLPIGRSPHDRQKMAVVETGRQAVTHWTSRERFRSFQLLEISLETGRTHQIRVHLADGNHPVLGDPEYGGRESRLRGMFGPERPFGRRILDTIDRQALHAFRLKFSHPVTGEDLALESPLPADFTAVLDLLRAEGV